jgi:hypothetical protein
MEPLSLSPLTTLPSCSAKPAPPTFILLIGKRPESTFAWVSVHVPSGNGMMARVGRRLIMELASLAAVRIG